MSDIIYKSITLIPHSRCLLLHDFLQHTVPESSFNISLSTATACGPILKQFITCVNYYPGAGWVWAGGCGVTVQSVYALVCCWATFESHPAVAVHQIMVKPSQTSPPLARTASRSEPRSLHPSSSSSSSASTYAFTFAFAYHCVCNSFLALLPQPLLSETCPFKATASPLRLISGSPWGDGGEKRIMQPLVFG